jgi:hypothetical protein
MSEQRNFTITRSMATTFVNKYHKIIPVNYKDSDVCMFDNFVVECIEDISFYTMIEEKSRGGINLYDFIREIYDTLYILEGDEKTNEENMRWCFKNILLCEKSLIYLYDANRNYHWLNKIIHKNYPLQYDYEILNDIANDEDICTICQYHGNTWFYYSTTFGLNKPVCETCVDSCGPTVESIKKDPDYVESVEDDSDNNELDHNELDHVVPTQQDYDDYVEYDKGFDDGWKSAMLYIKENIEKNKTAPRMQKFKKCDYCGMKAIVKNCGGSCNGTVKYCSIKCQTADWKIEHKFSCKK